MQFLTASAVEQARLTAVDANAGRTKTTLRYEDVAKACIEDEKLAFLTDLIPMPITLGEALQRRNTQEANFAVSLANPGNKSLNNGKQLNNFANMPPHTNSSSSLQQ